MYLTHGWFHVAEKAYVSFVACGLSGYFIIEDKFGKMGKIWLFAKCYTEWKFKEQNY